MKKYSIELTKEEILAIRNILERREFELEDMKIAKAKEKSEEVGKLATIFDNAYRDTFR